MYLKRLLRSLSRPPKLCPATRTLALLVLMLSALNAAGCAWSQAPTQSEALIAPYKINGRTDKLDAGQLLLVDKGLWAFLPQASAKKDFVFKPGELVGFLPQKRHASAHVYSVVLVRSWGALLQRLDSQPITGTELRGEFVPINNDPTFRQWGLCRGTGDVGAASCIKEASPSTQWRIFRTDTLGNIVTPELDAWSDTLPIQSAGVLIGERSVMHRSPDAADSNHWLAIPAHRPQRSRAQNTPIIPHARVAMQAHCPRIDLSQSFQPLEVFTSEINAPKDAIDTSMAAIRTGADVLVRCKGDTIWVDIPTLYRPIMAVADTSAQGISYGAMEPIALKGAPEELQRATILMGAALATGSTFIADFYLQEALRAAPKASEAGALGLKFMQVFAAAGRPEAALRSGLQAASGAWHLDNNPQFVLGRTWVDAALGDARAYSDDVSRLSKLAENPDHRDIRLWLAWSVIRADALKTSGRSVRGALSYFDNAGLLRWIQAANQIVSPSLRIELKKEHDAVLLDGLGLLSQPVATRADGKPCADAGVCQLDVYGRNFAARLDALRAAPSEVLFNALLRDLAQVSKSELRPEFESQAHNFEGFSATEELAIHAALMPVTPEDARARSFDALIAAASGAVKSDGNCIEIPGADIIARRLAPDARKASPAQLPHLGATHWLVSDAFEAACHSPMDFARSLEASLGHDETMARRMIPLLTALSEHSTPEARAQMLRQVADFSAQHKTGAACTRFNLALAYSNATAGHLDVAAKNLAKTVNCAADDSEKYAASQRLLNAYIQFETSAQLPAGLPEKTREALLELTRATPTSHAAPTCFGLEGLPYQLASYLHPDIVALAVSLSEPEEDDLALETSSRSLQRAIAAMQVAQRYLAEGQPAPAADSLLDARAAFARINHQVGLRRVAFLAQTIYGSDLESYRAAQNAAAEATPRRTSKRAPVSLSAPEKLSAADWSIALQQGQAEQIVAIFKAQKRPQTPESARALTAAKLLRAADDASALPPQTLGVDASALEALCQ